MVIYPLDLLPMVINPQDFQYTVLLYVLQRAEGGVVIGRDNAGGGRVSELLHIQKNTDPPTEDISINTKCGHPTAVGAGEFGRTLHCGCIVNDAPGAFHGCNNSVYIFVYE